MFPIMLLIPTILALLLVFISTRVFSKRINPVSAVLIWYLVFAWLSRLGLFRIYTPSEESLTLILSSIDFYGLIFIVIAKKGQIFLSNKDYEYIRINDKYLLGRNPWQPKLRKVIEILCLLLLLLIDLNIAIRVLTGGIQVSQIRFLLMNQDATEAMNVNTLYFSSIIRDVLTYFVRFFVFFDVVLEICKYFLYQNRINKIPIINFGLFCIAILTRIDIVKIAIIICICFGFINNRENKVKYFRKMSRKNKRIIIIAITLLILVMCMRVYDGQNILYKSFDNLFGGIIGAFQAFSQVFDRIMNDGPIAPFQTWKVFFGGITSIIDAFLVNGLHLNMEFTAKAINSYIEGVIYIGPGITFNAFYTMLYEFLAADGIIGCFIGTGMLGCAGALSYNKYKKYPCTASCMLFIIWTYVAIFGVYVWGGSLTTWACTVCILIGLHTRTKVSIKKRGRP